MKKLYICLITASAFTINNNVQSQPTLNGVDVNPVVGTSIITHTYNYAALVPGSGGANVTWNYASIGNTGNFNANIVAPSTTPYASQFVNANTAFYYPVQTAYQFFLCNATEYSHYGDVAGGTIVPFSNRETIYTFPLTYNNTGNDNFLGTFTNSGYTFYRYGTSTFHADGYGTLILPYGTLTNVLRVKFVEDYVDSANISGIPFVTTYHNDQYMWLKQGVHPFLLEYYTITGGGSTTTAGFYLDQSSVGFQENNAENLSYSVFPNPTSDFLHLTYELKNKSQIEINLLNSLGQNVQKIIGEEGNPGSYMKEISLSGLPKGIYTLQLIIDGNMQNKRVVLN
jgi:hypothetical protein